MTEEREGGALEHGLHKLEDIAGGLVGQAGAAMTDRAEDFVHRASVSDRFEIEASKLALQRAQSGQVRDFAQQMIEDHTAISGKLEASLTPELRTLVQMELDNRRQTMLDHLREAETIRFDKTYLDQQRLAHQEALTLMHHFRDKGDNPALRHFAAETAPMIEMHLKHVKDLVAAQ